MKILIVDDEPLILSSAARCLKGHELTLAASFEAAMEALTKGPYDVMVTDYNLNGGYTASDLLIPPELPFVLSSARVDLPDRLSMRAAGILPKPYNAADLRDAVGRAVG